MTTHLDTIRHILSSTLQLGDRTESMRMNTPLLGNIAELDSMAIVGVLTAIEESYGIVIDDDEISADTFETVGTLVRFVSSKCEEGFADSP